VNLKRLIIWSIIGTGISSVSTQLVSIREFLSQFHGNEITISLVLFCWLLLTGLGSLAAKAVRRPSLGLYSLLAFIVAIWPLLQITGIRWFREILFIHGTSPGFHPIFFYTFLMLSPYCLLVGYVLPYAQKTLNALGYPFHSGDLYLTDSLGDIAGGALFSFVLVYWLKPFPIIAFTSPFLVLVALGIFWKTQRYVLLVTGLVVACLFYYYSTNRQFEIRTLAPQYGNIVQYLESPFGRIVISREGPQHTFWGSGVPLYSDANVAKSEEKVHYPLCQVDQVEDVLLVSGGLGETVTEVSKYHPRHIDYVELDPHLTQAAVRLGVIKNIPGLKIINTDGRRYIKTTDKTYDAIIIDLPDPHTFQVNRFFTKEFFFLTKRILRTGGILSLSMEYGENYISEVRKKKLSTLFNTARSSYKKVMVLPGEEAYFLCRDGELSSDIPSRLKAKGIHTTYIEDFFYGNVTTERIRQLEGTLDRDEPVNTDFNPRIMSIVFHEWFMKHGTSPKYFLFTLTGLTALYLFFMKREEYVLFSTGLATMGVEMLVVFAFQVIYGYIYLQIGAIVTAFLLGLLPGAMVGNLSRGKGRFRLLFTEGPLLFLLLIFLGWVAFLRNELSPVYFLVYCFLFAFFCGFQFPVAAGQMGEETSPAAGCFAADLCGAAVGTLVTGTILIPLWGIRSAVLFLIFVKISSSMMIIFRGKERIQG
jgi:spermidine synthase